MAWGMGGSWEVDFGFDLGTSHTRVYLKNRGEVVREATTIAISSRTREITCIGTDAKLLSEQNIPDTEIIHPVIGGAVAFYEPTVLLLRALMEKAVGKRFVMKPRVVASANPGLTEVERRALPDAFKMAGAREVLFIDSTLAALFGARFGTHQTSCQLVIDIGGGTADIALISHGTVLTTRSIRFAGSDFDESVRRFIKHKYDMLVTPVVAENIKVRVGSVVPGKPKEQVTMDGVQMYGELFKSVPVAIEGIPELMSKNLQVIVGEVRWLLEEISAEQRSEILSNGVLLTGGMTLMRGVQQFFNEKVGIPVTVAADPIGCTNAGVSVVVHDHRRLRLGGKQLVAVS